MKMLEPNEVPRDLPPIMEEMKEKKKAKKEKKLFKGALGKRNYYVHVETTNESFLKLHHNLYMLGVKNNDFFLALYDTKLIGVNPYDPDLSDSMKLRIIKECQRNYWYFIREVVQIPVAGAPVGKGNKYAIHRGNLALSWCFFNNINIFLELPRQNYKSMSVNIILLWLYNFGTSNSEMMIMNKEHNDACRNLKIIRGIRDILPEYLRFNKDYNADGKELKAKDPKETAYNKLTQNTLVTKPSATSEDRADLLGRGCTQPVQWYDEWAFLKFNDVIYESATLAFSQASKEARRYGRPYCKIITTTPGDTKRDQGQYAYAFTKSALPFKEQFYDMPINEVQDLISRTDNGFVYAKFSYEQLGRSKAWFAEQVQELGGNMDKVRREVLLEWSSKSGNSPFASEDLVELARLAKKSIRTIYINRYFMFEFYDDVDVTVPLIMGVDVASGADKDFSAIALIDSRTKKMVGSFMSNRIDTRELASLIYTLATQYIRNVVIVIENNSIGQGVIANLRATDIRDKLYYEESTDDDISAKMKNGFKQSSNSLTRKYGHSTTGVTRPLMHDILLNAVSKFKYRISAEPLVEQIKSLEYTKSGRIDHMTGQHDDLVMAYLIGMYPYYYTNRFSRFGIMRFPDIEDGQSYDDIMYVNTDEFNRQTSAANTTIFQLPDKEDDLSELFGEQTEREYSQFEDMARDIIQQGNQPIKTMKDFYDEMDEENNKIANMQPNSVQFGHQQNISGNLDMFGNPIYNQNQLNNNNQNGVFDSYLDNW